MSESVVVPKLRAILSDSARAAVMLRVRYLCVGALCAFCNWAIMLLIDKNRFLLSSSVCFPLVGTIAYVLHAKWTFETETSVRAWARYLVAISPGYPISLAILFLLHDVAGLTLVFAIPATTVAMIVVIFIVTRWSLTSDRWRRVKARGARPRAIAAGAKHAR